MTSFNTGRPGVFIQEVALPQVLTLPDNGSAIGAIVGTLSKGPDDVPVLLQRWTDFVQTFGPLNDAYPTTWAAFNFFANGGRSLYVKRIKAEASAASVTLTDASTGANPTLTVTARSVGSWGNNLSVKVVAGSTSDSFNLVVSQTSIVSGRPTTTTVETWRDLKLVNTDPYYAINIVNSGSRLIKLTDLNSPAAAPTNIPAVSGTAVALTGGTDPNVSAARGDYSAAYATFDTIPNPLVFNIPDAAYIYDPVSGTSDARLLSIDIQADAVTYAAERGDSMVIIDVPSGLTPTDAQTYVSAVATAFSASSTGNVAAAYYPWLKIPNTLSAAPGALRDQAPGAAMVGQYLATDASRGVWKTPAGYSNRLALAVATQTQLTNAQLDALNSSADPINAIRQVPGVGIVVMGGRTLDNTPGNRYINVRRSLNYLENELTRLSSFAVFENNDERLWAQLRTALGTFLRNYWQQGGLRGTSPAQAYYVICDSSNNSFADISNGTVNITIGVALEYPAEFIVIQLGQLTASATA
jgi:phage tail sheath protein FI